jgi:ABC-type Zn2+ transport system substrate-binding protein/surface adhesin
MWTIQGSFRACASTRQEAKIRRRAQSQTQPTPHTRFWVSKTWDIMCVWCPSELRERETVTMLCVLQMRVQMHAHTHIHTRTHIHTHAHTHTHTRTHARTHTRMHAHIYTHAHTHTHTHTHYWSPPLHTEVNTSLRTSLKAFVGKEAMEVCRYG